MSDEPTTPEPAVTERTEPTSEHPATEPAATSFTTQPAAEPHDIDVSAVLSGLAEAYRQPARRVLSADEAAAVARRIARTIADFIAERDRVRRAAAVTH